jgi:hypothetical protein
MKTITIKLVNGTIQDYATNTSGEGVFIRKSDGTFRQTSGTCQTPIFTTAQQFRKWLSLEKGSRMIKNFGW